MPCLYVHSTALQAWQSKLPSLSCLQILYYSKGQTLTALLDYEESSVYQAKAAFLWLFGGHKTAYKIKTQNWKSQVKILSSQVQNHRIVEWFGWKGSERPCSGIHSFGALPSQNWMLNFRLSERPYFFWLLGKEMLRIHLSPWLNRSDGWLILKFPKSL